MMKNIFDIVLKTAFLCTKGPIRADGTHGESYEFPHGKKAGDNPQAAQQDIQRVAERKLIMIHRAGGLNDLRIPPGNRLEALTGNRKGQHGIRINDQWRICFEWRKDGVYNVEITDYH
jgi:proteic killer suppression protein